MNNMILFLHKTRDYYDMIVSITSGLNLIVQIPINLLFVTNEKIKKEANWGKK